MNTTQLIANAQKLNHGSHTVALAASVLKIKGVRALCCWCAESVSGEATRLGGECEGCHYVGHDCLVVVE